jgi:membrane protein implicated in regulation of membrane protease activity
MDWFSGSVEFWHWWILGVALIALEIFAPGTHLLFIGIAAGIVGLLILVVPDLAISWQILLFAVLSVVAVYAGRSWLKRRPIESEDPGLNRRGEQFVGRVVTLDEAIANGVGKARVGDSVWRVVGPDMPQGQRVRVVGADGATLRVEATEDTPSAA